MLKIASQLAIPELYILELPVDARIVYLMQYLNQFANQHLALMIIMLVNSKFLFKSVQIWVS